MSVLSVRTAQSTDPWISPLGYPIKLTCLKWNLSSFKPVTCSSFTGSFSQSSLGLLLSETSGLFLTFFCSAHLPTHTHTHKRKHTRSHFVLHIESPKWLLIPCVLHHSLAITTHAGVLYLCPGLCHHPPILPTSHLFHVLQGTWMIFLTRI